MPTGSGAGSQHRIRPSTTTTPRSTTGTGATQASATARERRGHTATMTTTSTSRYPVSIAEVSTVTTMTRRTTTMTTKRTGSTTCTRRIMGTRGDTAVTMAKTITRMGRVTTSMTSPTTTFTLTGSTPRPTPRCTAPRATTNTVSAHARGTRFRFHPTWCGSGFLGLDTKRHCENQERHGFEKTLLSSSLCCKHPPPLLPQKISRNCQSFGGWVTHVGRDSWSAARQQSTSSAHSADPCNHGDHTIHRRTAQTQSPPGGPARTAGRLLLNSIRVSTRAGRRQIF